MSKLDDALKLAAKGFYLFPLIPNSKLPAIDDYSNKATRDPGKLKEFFEGKNNNIAIATSRYWDAETKSDKALLVLDVDAKKGKPGYESLKELKKKHDLPPTFTQRTPTNGVHIIYKSERPYRQGVNVFGSGIDTRSYGGYVVAAGSTIDGKQYEIAHNGNPNPEPGWVNAVLAAKVLQNKKGPVQDVLTIPSAINRSIDYLRHHAPVAIEGDGGDTTTFKVAAHVRDFGVSKDDCLKLLGDYWNEKNFPPWSYEDLEKKVDNAYRYAENEPGVLAAEHDFKPEKKENKFHFKFADSIKEVTQNNYLIKNIIDKQCLSVVYGDSNSGKTFLALDMAFKVSEGEQWNGSQVDRGAVMYIAAEGGNALNKRVIAYRNHFNLGGKSPLAIVPCPINLLNPRADLNDLISLGREIEKESGMKLELIVVDTLARAIAGGNENASEDMGAFVRSLDHLKNALKSHVMVIHHTGKNAAKGARGHSSLRAATDTEIEILPGEMRLTKQRDMDIGQPIAFRLNQVTIGKDQDGDIITSCVIETTDLGPVKKISGQARSVLTILENTFKGEAHEDDLKAEFINEYCLTGKKSSGNKAFHRALSKLVEANRVVEVGEKIMIPSKADGQEFLT